MPLSAMEGESDDHHRKIIRTSSPAGEESSENDNEKPRFKPPTSNLPILGSGQMTSHEVELFTLSLINWSDSESYAESLHDFAIKRTEQGDYKAAIQNLNQIRLMCWQGVCDLHPRDHGHILGEIALNYYHLGQYSEAVQHINAALQLRDEDGPALDDEDRRMLSNALSRIRGLLEASVSTKKKVEELLLSIGQTLNPGNSREAISALQPLFELKLEGKFDVLTTYQYAVVHHLLGRAHGYCGEYETSTKHFLAAIEQRDAEKQRVWRGDDRTMSLLEMGAIFNKAEQPRLAIKAYQKALAQEYEDRSLVLRGNIKVRVLSQLGGIFFKGRNYGEALTVFEQAFALSDLEAGEYVQRLERARLAKVIGFCNANLGNVPKAISFLEIALQMIDDQGNNYLQGGERYDSQRKLDRLKFLHTHS